MAHINLVGGLEHLLFSPLAQLPFQRGGLFRLALGGPFTRDWLPWPVFGVTPAHR